VFVEGEWLSALVCMHVIDFLKIRRREQIKLLSQLRLHGRFSLTPTSYLAEYEEYNLDGQGDIKESSQSQSNPADFRIVCSILRFGAGIYSSNSP
jgi:hypothetical protein